MRIKIIMVLVSGILAISCAGPKTVLTSSAKITQSEPNTYKKLAVLALAPKTSSRANVEEALATLLRTKGIKAVSTFTMFPLANHMEEVRKNSDATEEEIKARIREKIDFREIDAVLVLAVLDSRKEERYVQKGMSLSVSAPTVQYADPVYNYEFTDYYSYSYATIYNPGYYETSTTFFIESNLYDVSTGALVYTAQLSIKDPQKLGEDSEQLAEVLVEDLFRKNAFKK